MRTRSTLGAALLAAASAALAQSQAVKPPVSRAWIDVATFSGMGKPVMGMGGAGGANPMAMMGSEDPRQERDEHDARHGHRRDDAHLRRASAGR